MKLHRDAFANVWFPFSYHQDLLDYPPIVMDHGAGVYLYDKSGRGYLDAIGSWWVNTLGHNNQEITEAIKAQADKLEHVLMAGFITEPTLQMIDLLVKMLPRGLCRVFLSDDGSTAVEAALKMALQYWSLRGENRTEFVSLAGGYHGDTLGAMSVGMIPQYHSLIHQRYKSFHYASSPYCYRCPAGKDCESCSAECMDSLEAILQQHADSVAAFIFEPMVQAAAGMRVYPAKVIKRIFHLCRHYHVLTIADEIAVGFGRTGKLFACEHAKETPDIMCLAKGLTGGYLPLAATVVRDEIYQHFCGAFPSDKILHHGHSFTGNPLASAAALAALRIMEREKIPASLEQRMEHFKVGLQRFGEFDIVGDIRSIGMVGALELVKDRNTREKLPGDGRLAFRIARRALDLGLLIRPLGDVLYFMPAYVISEDVIDNMFYLANVAIRQIIDEQQFSE